MLLRQVDRRVFLILFAFATTLVAVAFFIPNSKAVTTPLHLQTLDRPTAKIYYVRIPAGFGYQLLPAVSPSLDLLPNLVKQTQATPLVAINGGFFDPANKQTTSYVVLKGQVIADPTQNARLMHNPDLKPYMNAMLHRSELIISTQQGKPHFAIKPHTSITTGDSLQAGPNLLDPKSMETEAFVAYQHGKRVRDPIGVDRPNARSAVGFNDHGDVVLVMAAMKPLPNHQPSGVTLAEMAEIMQDLGATHALSLDGGSSTTLWFNGQTIYGKLDKNLNAVKRPVKSALVIVKAPDTP